MNLMTCKECGIPNINRTDVEDWDEAWCPICGANLKKQLEDEVTLTPLKSKEKKCKRELDGLDE